MNYRLGCGCAQDLEGKLRFRWGKKLILQKNFFPLGQKRRDINALEAKNFVAGL